MLTDTITFEKALQLEGEGKIFIFDSGDNKEYHERAKEWQNNFIQLRTKPVMYLLRTSPSTSMHDTL